MIIVDVISHFSRRKSREFSWIQLPAAIVSVLSYMTVNRISFGFFWPLAGQQKVTEICDSGLRENRMRVCRYPLEFHSNHREKNFKKSSADQSPVGKLINNDDGGRGPETLRQRSNFGKSVRIRSEFHRETDDFPFKIPPFAPGWSRSVAPGK